MKTVDDIVKETKRFNTLCRNVLSSGEGRELLKYLEKIFVDNRLYHDTDRETVYAVAQRDLIVELKSHTVSELPVDIED